MTDLDFDELDRAVNSLISSAPGTATKEENEEKTLTLSDDASVIPPSEPDTSTPPVNPVILSADEPTPPTIELSDVAESAETSENSETTEASEPEATVEEPTTPPAEDTIAAAPALAAKRSSGRFMDVVHPSSDMRSSTPLMSTPRPPVSSFGATITPPAETVTAVTPDPTPTAADWPDPLDFNGPKAEEVPVVAVGTPVTDAVDDDDDIDKIANDINASLSGQPEEAQTSPFLPDAKVEKRPLGAFSDEAPAAPVTPLAPAEVGIPESSGAPTSPPVHAADDAQVEQIDVPLPDELQSDLLSIESDDSTLAIPEATPAAGISVAQTATPIGPTAITQQYKEEPSTGDQQSGSIFDTKSYHTALAHPAKKKGGWMWIVWILALLVVGGAVGAAAYYLVLPRL